MAGINLWKYSVIEGAFSLDELIRERALFREEFRTNVLDELAKLYTNEGMRLGNLVHTLIAHNQKAIYGDSIYDIYLCSVFPELISEAILIVMDRNPFSWGWTVDSGSNIDDNHYAYALVYSFRTFNFNDEKQCDFIYQFVNKVGNDKTLKIMKRWKP